MKSKWSKVGISFYTTADVEKVRWLNIVDLLSIKLQKESYLLDDFQVYIDAELKIKPNKKWWKFW